jgi:hypothetical protein
VCGGAAAGLQGLEVLSLEQLNKPIARAEAPFDRVGLMVKLLEPTSKSGKKDLDVGYQIQAKCAPMFRSGPYMLQHTPHSSHWRVVTGIFGAVHCSQRRTATSPKAHRR